MTDKKRQTEAGAIELNEGDLEKAQGGWSWGVTQPTFKHEKKADKFSPDPKQMERVHEDE